MNLHRPLTECQARTLGLMSDDQYARELRLQKQFFGAVAILRSAIQDLNAGSSVVKANPDAFDDYLHDWTPDQEFWDSELKEARNG